MKYQRTLIPSTPYPKMKYLTKHDIITNYIDGFDI